MRAGGECGSSGRSSSSRPRASSCCETTKTRGFMPINERNLHLSLVCPTQKSPKAKRTQGSPPWGWESTTRHRLPHRHYSTWLELTCGTFSCAPWLERCRWAAALYEGLSSDFLFSELAVLVLFGLCGGFVDLCGVCSVGSHFSKTWNYTPPPQKS